MSIEKTEDSNFELSLHSAVTGVVIQLNLAGTSGFRILQMLKLPVLVRIPSLSCGIKGADGIICSCHQELPLFNRYYYARRRMTFFCARLFGGLTGADKE